MGGYLLVIPPHTPVQLVGEGKNSKCSSPLVLTPLSRFLSATPSRNSTALVPSPSIG